MWGQVPRQLGTQGVLAQLACWWVGLCPHSANCLAWDIPGWVPTGWWAGPGPALISWREDSKMVLTTTSVLVVGCTPKNSCCQHLCPQGEFQLPPASLGGSLRSASGSDPLKSLLLPWVSEYVRFCECPLRVESISYIPLALPKASPAGLQSQMFWGLVFLMQDPLAWGVWRGAWTPCFLGKTSAIIIILLFVGCPPRGMGLDYTPISTSLPLLSHCGSFLIFLAVEDLFH